MSADVSLVVIRKSDYAPFDKFWLGGNGTRDAILRNPKLSDKLDTSVEGGDVVPVTEGEIRHFLIHEADEFYLGNFASSALEFLEEHQPSLYAFFLVIE